jgi:hypothetical protein
MALMDFLEDVLSQAMQTIPTTALRIGLIRLTVFYIC